MLRPLCLPVVARSTEHNLVAQGMTETTRVSIYHRTGAETDPSAGKC